MADESSYEQWCNNVFEPEFAKAVSERKNAEWRIKILHEEKERRQLAEIKAMRAKLNAANDQTTRA